MEAPGDWGGIEVEGGGGILGGGRAHVLMCAGCTCYTEQGVHAVCSQGQVCAVYVHTMCHT